MNKLLQSSVNPKDLSLTIKGVLTMLVPMIAIALNLAGKQVDDATITSIIDAITNVVATAATTISAFMVLYGLVRKLVLSFKK